MQNSQANKVMSLITMDAPAGSKKTPARVWVLRSLQSSQSPASEMIPRTCFTAASALEAEIDIPEDDVGAVRTVSEQLGVGGVLGVATGYAARRLGRALAVAVGTEILLLQYMSYRGWVVVNWSSLANDMRPKLDKGALDAARDIVLYKLPFASAFSVGMAAGLRLSA